MGLDAIDQTICPEVLGMTKCSIAFGQHPHPLNNCILVHVAWYWKYLFLVSDFNG